MCANKESYFSISKGDIYWKFYEHSNKETFNFFFFFKGEMYPALLFLALKIMEVGGCLGNSHHKLAWETWQDTASPP